MYSYKRKEEVYERCKNRKKALDNRMRIISALMLTGPFVVLVLMILTALPSEVNRIVNQRGRAGGTHVSFVGALISCVFALGETVGGSARLIKFAPVFYLGEFIFAIFLLIGGNVFYAMLFFIVSAVSFVLSILYRKFYNEEQEMRKLDGYPDFNPILIPRINKGEESGGTEPSEMAPDERLIYERENGL